MNQTAVKTFLQDFENFSENEKKVINYLLPKINQFDKELVKNFMIRNKRYDESIVIVGASGVG